MKNILELKTVNQLQEFNFFVPSYQRGYRWTEKEVVELLEDISNFNPRLVDDSDEKTWYCLQPIVLKENDTGLFEVIDGQQRLTTIYLILFYLNQDFVEAKRDKLFQLHYETRTRSETFLASLDKIENEEDNIDFHFIANAYKKIGEWFLEKGNNFDTGDFRSKFKFHSKVIWYLSNEEDSIAIFTRINIGKIPLTNSELIKALFLNSSNFNKQGKVRLKQLEISTEWDQIEQSLQNDKFWYFITQKKASTNRIELLFELLNEEIDGDDNYSTFRFFYKKFKSSSDSCLEDNWNAIKKLFQRFNEWFSERDLYHKIGYLVSINAINLKELYQQSSTMSKTEFRVHLDSLIREQLKNIDITTLQYSDGKNVRSVLLLYNILTMLNSEKDNSYFPFDLFKKEKWDIEHIASIKERQPDKNRERWLEDTKNFIDKDKPDASELIERIESYQEGNSDFSSLFEDIVSHFNSDLNEEDDINDLSNLTLLDSETNRGYKNSVFPIKRKIIIDRDKQGVFIPVCTKNVFLKYFSDYPPRISFWSEEDRENYEKDLYNILNSYLDQKEVTL
ncbi:MAG: DUF262 domain-containing protein [Candidatus Electrothrix sp. ATG2]|nr:DUF262 domain-containing protein [Candidatus Electrothrix sp. ATG2]